MEQKTLNQIKNANETATCSGMNKSRLNNASFFSDDEEIRGTCVRAEI